MPTERWTPSERDYNEPFVDFRTRIQRLRKWMTVRKKADIVEALVDMAIEEMELLDQLESRFMPTSSVEQRVAATRKAIDVATKVDKRQVNYNFHYDKGAYELVEKNLRALVESDHFDAAMELAILLMHKGSCQVEMSDEGLMTSNIEACLKVVIDGVGRSRLPADQITAWCNEMSEVDRVRFLCATELRELRRRNS